MIEGSEDEELGELDPGKVREYMFEAISAMGPRLFRPSQEAHVAYGLPQPDDAPEPGDAAAAPESLWPMAALGAGAFIAGAVAAVIWRRCRS